MGFVYAILAILGIGLVILILLVLWSNPFELFNLLIIAIVIYTGIFPLIFPYQVKTIIVNNEGLKIYYWYRTNKLLKWERISSLEIGNFGGTLCQMETELGVVTFRVGDIFGLRNGHKLVDEIIKEVGLIKIADKKMMRRKFFELKRLPLFSRKIYKRLSAE